jgi:hypothetical protein
MVVDFKSDAHRKVHQLTREYLYSLFGEVNVQTTEDAFTLREGSSVVYVRTFPVGSERAAVEVFSYVAIDLEITDALMRELLAHNLKLVLGAFGLAVGPDGKGSVVLTYTLLGGTMDQEELYGAICAIARVADDLDDQLVSSFGGKTALGKLTEASIRENWE